LKETRTACRFWDGHSF